VKNKNWSTTKKVFFRFFFVYLFIYCFPFPLDSFEFTTPIAKPFYNFLDFLIPRIAEKFFHLHAKTAFELFDKVDDSNYGLVFLYTNLIVSAIVTLAWSILDRKRNNYELLYQWLRLYIRYFLSAYLFGYGFIKVFPSQFQSITASRLVMTVGDQPPMLLAWNFMGYSRAFQMFMGITEVIAGILVLFRRTTTLGAILSAFTFGFVSLMDFCFNVPVRLLALHLLFISLFLVFDDIKRLLNVLLLNKPAYALTYTPLFTNSAWRKVLLGLQALYSICILYKTITESVTGAKTFGQDAPHGPLYGVYNTTWFIKNTDTLAPLGTDSLRWKKFVIDGGDWHQSGIIQLNTDKNIFYNIKVDTVKQMLNLRGQADTTEKYSLHYSLPDSNHLIIEGKWKNDSIRVGMNKYDLNNYILFREKFEWIKE
jgi:hypothetical protein